MSYMVISPDDTYAVCDGAPDDTTLMALVGHGAPELARTMVDGVVLWVDDDFLNLHAQGKAPRNIMGTVMGVGLGATSMVYCGPMVITGLDENPMGGYRPAPLDDQEFRGLVRLADDVRRIVRGQIPPDVAPDVVEAVAAAAAVARVRRVEPPAMTVSVMGVDELLKALGIG